MPIVADGAGRATVDIDALRERCRRLHVTHDQIAAECGVTRNSVCMVLNDKRVSRRIVQMAQRMADKAERAPGR